MVFGKQLKPGEKDPNIIRPRGSSPPGQAGSGRLRRLDAQPSPFVSRAPGKRPCPSHQPPSRTPGKYDVVNAIERAWDDFQKWEDEQRERRQQAELVGVEYKVDRQEELERTRTSVMVIPYDVIQ